MRPAHSTIDSAGPYPLSLFGRVVSADPQGHEFRVERSEPNAP